MGGWGWHDLWHLRREVVKIVVFLFIGITTTMVLVSSRVRTREDSGLRGKRGSDGDGASLWRVLLEISESWRQGSAILSHSMAS